MGGVELLADERPAGPERRSSPVVEWAVGVGAVIAPFACILAVVTMIVGISAIWHDAQLPSYPANVHGVSLHRREASVLASAFLGATGPVVMSCLWFDWLRTKLNRRMRLSLMGYLGGVIASMSLTLLLAYT